MKTGEKIPEILGRDQNGREIKASDYAGRKLVLYTYPKANTPGCTAEACSLEAHKDELRALGYEIVGVSRDSEVAQTKFAEKYNLSFPLIADTDTTLLKELGAWGEKNMYGKTVMGIIRTTFLVNEEGIVEAVFSGKQIKTKIHAEQLLEYLNGK
jgi:bacterioferritin comigratory protein